MTTSRARGAVFTPDAIGRRLVHVATGGQLAPVAICDPAAGDGRLLRAALDHLSPGHRSFGADLHEVAPVDLAASWTVRNTLLDGLGAWPDAPAGGFDLVIGNPPFRGQLRQETWLRPDERDRLVDRYGDLARSYTDIAALFLVAACEMAAADGRVAFIMPLSFLAARDAAPARRRVLELATLDGLWICPEHVFPDAQVQVCAVILDRSGPRQRPVRRWVGEGFDPVAPVIVDSDQLRDTPTWSHLAAPAFDIPEVDLGDHGTLGRLVSATAGFRDQFYGLAPLVADHPGSNNGRHAPLITSGLVDPGSVAWSRRAARIGGRDWLRPSIDIDALDTDSSLGRWVTARRNPKIVVATQTRVIEAAPDPEGKWIPSTPVIAAHADGDDLWRALAVLLAPPVSAWARARHTGAARSANAVKLSARQVESLPLPPDTAGWDEAARDLAASHRRHGTLTLDDVRAAGETMTAAYRCDPAVTAWWADLLAPRASRRR